MTVSEQSASDTASGDRAHIQLDGVRKVFDDTIVACTDIDLKIDEDEFVVLVGPSGCGKTTTLRIISGLEIPTEGTVHIAGEEVTYAEPKDRDLAFVFQNVTLFPHKDVRENIRFGLDMKTDLSADEKNERVDEAGEVLGIGDLLDRNTKELSGGQRQRVSLGRAMVMEPNAFLLDEPFSALDANLRDEMRVEIKKLQRKLETTMIFVTHDQEEAMTLGDRIVVMNEGRIQQIGSPHEIFNDPENLFVAEFIGSPSTNVLEGSLRYANGTPNVTVDGLFETALDAPRFADLEEFDEGPVRIGVRPDYLTLVDDPDGGLFPADLQVVEPQGSFDAVYLNADDQELTAQVSQGTVAGDVERVGVDVDTDELWLFDTDGSRLV